MKTYHFFPIFLLLLFSYVGLHFYSARWLARSFSLGQPAAHWLRIALLTAAFLSPFTMFLKRYHHAPLFEVFYAAGYAWMGIIMLAAFIFYCSDLAAIGLRRLPGFQPQLLSGATLALLALIIACGIYGGQKVPVIKEVTVPIKDLPPELEGFKIAQISDMHMDSNWKLRQFSAVVDEINAVSPDLVLVTGDLLDPGLTRAADLAELTGRIKSRLGLFGSLGNHEYYYGLERSIDCYRDLGIKLLRNEALVMGKLRLIGLGDIHTEHLTETDVTEQLKKNSNGEFTIVMSHQPVFYPAIAAAGDYLVLSGHTHKGQIFPFHIFTKLFYKYFYGLYRINNSVFYVTSGAGTWAPPCAGWRPRKYL
jgi:predicted MPP superfamily phosphohydrolase